MDGRFSRRSQGTLLYMAVTLKTANGNATVPDYVVIVVERSYLRTDIVVRADKRRRFAPELRGEKKKKYSFAQAEIYSDFFFFPVRRRGTNRRKQGDFHQ